MTYSLCSYSYSFQNRLRELATPVEAYHLQIADVDATADLKPFESPIIVNDLHLPSLSGNLEPDDDPDDEDVVPLNFPNDTLLLPGRIIVDGDGRRAIDYFKSQPFLCLDEITCIRCINCTIDQEFLDFIKKRNGNIPCRDTFDLDCERCVIADGLTINTTYETLFFILDRCRFEGAFFSDVMQLLMRDKSAFKHSSVTVYSDNVYELLQKIQKENTEWDYNKNPVPTSYETISFYVDTPDDDDDSKRQEIKLWRNEGFVKNFRDFVRCSVM